MASRLLRIVAWILRSVLSMALTSHVLLKRLLALDAGCSSAARSLPFTEGCPVSGNLAFGPGIGDSSLDIAERYSCCTVLSTPLPWDVAVIPASSIAGQRMSGTTSGVPCVPSFVAWGHPPRDSGASPESRVHDSCSCGLTSSTCLLSRGAEAATRSDNCPALSCGGNAPRGLSSASTVASGSLTSWGLSFPRVLQFDDPASGWVGSLLTTRGAGPPLTCFIDRVSLRALPVISCTQHKKV